VHLAELLVVLAIVGVVLAGLVGVFQHGQQAYLMGIARVDAQQSARVALERMASELRGAGFDPQASGFSPLGGTSATGFTIRNDLSGDGAISGRPEAITYSLRGRTLRRNAGGGAQPVAEGVESLSIVYLDDAGQPAGTPDGIRAVLITITTAGGAGAGRVRMTTQVRLRNR
jgi:Tfp pilus assembly protein PilW